MASKEELLASLIEEQKVLAEQAQAIAIINQNDDKSTQFNINNETEHEYVYWARRGELETAVEVEVCSSNGSENQEVGTSDGTEEMLVVDEPIQRNAECSTEQVSNSNATNTSQSKGSINIQDCFPKYYDSEHQRRMEEKRETAKLQEQLMNQEYQKAIGYLLCSSKSKSGKQKKKQTMTAYLFFCRRYRSKIVARNPKMSFAQISKLLSHMWRNASEQEKNTYRMKLEQHRTKVNAIVEKNMIEKMKLFKQQKLSEEIRRRNEEIRNMVVCKEEDSIQSSSNHETECQEVQVQGDSLLVEADC